MSFPPTWIETPEGIAALEADRAQTKARMAKSGIPLSTSLSYLYNCPKSVHPSEAWSRLPSAKAEKADKPYWDACSIYGVDESECPRLSQRTREQTPYRGPVRGYDDRKFVAPQHKQAVRWPFSYAF